MGPFAGKRPGTEAFEQRELGGGAGGAILLAAGETGVLHGDASVLALFGRRGAGPGLLGGCLARLARDLDGFPQPRGELLDEKLLIHPASLDAAGAGRKKCRRPQGGGTLFACSHSFCS